MAGPGNQRPVTVVGAGFSGLCAAYHLVRAGYHVEVHEASERPGGLINTLALPFARVETAANGLLNSPAVEELFSSVGLPLTTTLPTARKRFIFRGKPRRFPLGFWGVLGLAWFFVKFALARRDLVAPRTEETVREWGHRVMGREATTYLIEGALQGIYAGDAGRMSATLILGRFFPPAGPGERERRLSNAIHQWRLKRAERKAGGAKPVKRIRGTVSAPGGMGELIDRMRAYLEGQGVVFKFSSTVDLASEPSHPVVVATSAPQAARLLSVLDPSRSGLLSQIELVPIVTATVAYREPSLYKGFGCLFPPVEKRQALGVLMNNFIFPNRAHEGYSETWILGGAGEGSRELLAKSDTELLALIQSERHLTLKVASEIIGHKITRWPQAIPHYTVELERLLPGLRGTSRNCVLTGNYLGQIGLGKILEATRDLPEELNRTGKWHA